MLRVAKIFSDGMVLQRNKKVRIWGWADSTAKVSVSIQGQQVSGYSDVDGKWTAILRSLTASEKEELVVRTEKEEIHIQNVAVGEVWIAGGQSNMEFQLCFEKHREKEMQNKNPNLRFYDVPEISYPGQDADFDYSNVGIWRTAEGEDLKYFSAVGYYFQKELEEKLSVPVGIVGCNWGGTRSCAWMREDTVRRVGRPWMENYEASVQGLDMEQYWAEQKNNPMNDRGNPNMDFFGEFLLARTPSEEEFAQIFAQGGEQMAAMQAIVDPKTRPGSLYENMVLEIAGFTAKGVLWYQGESDDVPGLQGLYGDMLSALIKDWRDSWKDSEMPFFVVQLPGWRTWMQQDNIDYVTIRDCQERVAKEVNNVYLVSISDVGEEMDIHPKDKKTVGHRIALLARKYIYGEMLLCEAPAADYAVKTENEVIITFCNAGKSLKIAGDRLNALELLADGNMAPFAASVQGDKLILSADLKGKEKIEVRFARSAWYQVNLFNEADIPAIPFQIVI